MKEEIIIIIALSMRFYQPFISAIGLQKLYAMGLNETRLDEFK
jgi:hypothetical protein